MSKPPCPNPDCPNPTALRLIVDRGEGRRPDVWFCHGCGEEFAAEKPPAPAERWLSIKAGSRHGVPLVLPGDDA